MRVSYAGCRGEYWGDVTAMRILTHELNRCEINLELRYGETFCWTMDASELERLAYQLLDALEESRNVNAGGDVQPPEALVEDIKRLIAKHLAEYPLEGRCGSNP